MLSISKLSTGQHRYYLDRAGARVDVVESVGDGAEEYYVGGTEARGEWLGAGVRELGLEGVVDGEALRLVLAGEDDEGGQLRASRVPVRVAGYDLTFSAPKSVSVLFALGDVDVREAVRAAHDKAIREALGYIERTAARPARRRRLPRRARRRLHRGGVPAPDVMRRRPATPHARAGRQPRAGAGWAMVDFGRPSPLYARARDEPRLPGGAPERADARVGNAMAERAGWHRRDRRCAEAGPQGVQPAPRGRRGGTRVVANLGPSSIGSRRACDSTGEGSAHELPGAPARLA